MQEIYAFEDVPLKIFWANLFIGVFFKPSCLTFLVLGLAVLHTRKKIVCTAFVSSIISNGAEIGYN